MSRGKLRLADYLTHILEAIERIGQYTEDMVEVTFQENWPTVTSKWIWRSSGRPSMPACPNCIPR